MGQSVALKQQSLLDVLYLEHILDAFGHFIGIINKNQCAQTIKADQARRQTQITFCLLQNIRHIQHIHT